MKKFLIIAAAAGTVLASCAKTETVEVSDAKYIGFDSAWIGNPTKAVTETTIGNLGSFFVYGGYDGSNAVFTGTEVSPNSNGVWTYSPLVSWEDNKEYHFYAYSKLPDGASASLTTYNNFVISDVKADKDHQSDFVYDDATYNSGDGSTPRQKVPFTFEHKLSMIKFTLKSGFAKDVTLTISDFKVYGMMSNNALTNGTWGFANTQIEAEDAIALKNGEAQAAEEAAVNYEDDCIVMPQTFNAKTVFAEFKVTASGTSITGVSEKTIKAEIPASTAWQPGYRYNYIVTIDGQTLDYITFDTPTVTQWADETVNMVNDETTSGQVVVDNQGN